MAYINQFTSALDQLNFRNLYGTDFFQTRGKSRDELMAIIIVADTLRALREDHVSTRIFDTGLGISLSRDPAPNTRFTFAAACNLLGLSVHELEPTDIGTDAVARVSTLADVIGIQNTGQGIGYLRALRDVVNDVCWNEVRNQRPALINLQWGTDHPVQCLADLNHMIRRVGGKIEYLRGKKIAVTWAYSPSSGTSRAIPQGIIGLCTRFGMNVHLAYPEGYGLQPDVEVTAQKSAGESGGTFTVSHSMDEAFQNADLVYPIHWTPFAVTTTGDATLEPEYTAIHNQHQDWECTESRMKITRDGNGVYLHGVSTDVSGVHCAAGEVSRAVFDRHRLSLAEQASHQPYIIAAMILLSKMKYPQRTLTRIAHYSKRRFYGAAS